MTSGELVVESKTIDDLRDPEQLTTQYGDQHPKRHEGVVVQPVKFRAVILVSPISAATGTARPA